MCGIAGIFSNRLDEHALRSDITAMTAAIAHRGPDGRGEWISDGIALGHRRLSIIDLEGGAQPFVSADKRYVLTFNGEIYNYRELRRHLAQLGYAFKTTSDTEVLIVAWQQWGVESVSRLKGMFAFAIWDDREKQLWLVRDRVGIKPLHYSFRSDNTFVFASELKALISSSEFRSNGIRYDALLDYLTIGYVPLDKTIFNNASKVLPAQVVCFDAVTGHVKRTSYWSPLNCIGQSIDSRRNAGELRELILSVVRKQSVADVPIASFLSGGVDSGGVTAAIAQSYPGELSAYTMSIGGAKYDESKSAALLASHCRVRHLVREVDISSGFSASQLAKIYDEPFADSSAIPTIELCAFAAQGHKVALSGDGGDESFLGYPWYKTFSDRTNFRTQLSGPLLMRSASLISSVLTRLARHKIAIPGRGNLLALSRDQAGDLLSLQQLDPFFDAKKLLPSGIQNALSEYQTADLFRDKILEFGVDDPYLLAQLMDLNFYLPGDILTKVDRASMASSLEVRVPLLDEDVLDYVLSSRPNELLPGNRRKGLLIDAFTPLLPNGYGNLPKRGFSVPLSEWFNGTLSSIMSDLSNRHHREGSTLLNADCIDEILLEHREGVADRSNTLWSVLMLDATTRNLGITEW